MYWMLCVASAFVTIEHPTQALFEKDFYLPGLQESGKGEMKATCRLSMLSAILDTIWADTDSNKTL